MRILFLTPDLPHPPRQGTALRNWGLIAELSARHEVSLLSFGRAGASISAELAVTCARVEVVAARDRAPRERLRTLLLSREPDLAHRLASDRYRRRLRAMLAAQRYDVIHIEGLEMGPYLEVARNQSDALIIYDAHNAETLNQQRMLRVDAATPARWHAALYSTLQLSRLRNFERRICAQADAVLCVSDTDAAALRTLDSRAEPFVAPNGIFPADYVDIPDMGLLPPASLVFTGKMDYRPNVDAALWFAKHVFPRVRAQRAQAVFVVVGKNPVRAVQRLAAQAGVVVTGAVDDIKPYLADAAVYVAPIRMGGGTRFKILEALALGRAVVSTTLGAEGFAVENERELILADTAAAQAEAINSLLLNRARRTQLGAAGRKFVESAHDWAKIAPLLEKVYAERGRE